MILMTCAYLMLDPAFSPYSYFGGACTVGALVFLALASNPEEPRTSEAFGEPDQLVSLPEVRSI